MTDLLPEEKITKSTYDELAAQWASEHSTPEFWQDEMRYYLELLPSGKIIEVGSGGGRDAKELIKLGYDYLGTDVSTGLLEIARKELPDFSFYEQSVYDLNFNGEQFDGFWASAVLLHVPKSRINKALARIRTVVRTKAIGFVSIKDGSGERQEIDEVGGVQLERFFSYWSRDNFSDHLAGNGFKILDYRFRPMSEKTKWHCFL